MMKIISIFILNLLLISCSSHGLQSKDNLVVGVVYYFDFDVERITGIPESQIDEYGCMFNIKYDDFKKSLLSDKDVSDYLIYNANDVRAMISFGSEIYYVDREGIVKLQDKKYSILNKEKLVKILYNKTKCR